MDRKYRAWAALLLACNQPFRFVSHSELAAGVLNGRGTGCAMCRFIFALAPDSRSESCASRGIAARSGRFTPGVADGHCKPYRQAPWMSCSGVRQETGLH